MTSVYRKQANNVKPPERGSFPLDHEGVCKEMMGKYMKCLRENKYQTSGCRELSKSYLACRMESGLMAPDDFKNLGFQGQDPVSVPASMTKETR